MYRTSHMKYEGAKCNEDILKKKKKHAIILLPTK
jgi:hypothetical protein